MDQGLLVPDELVVDLVVDRLGQDDCERGYVLDSFPRTIPQAEALDEALAKLGEGMDYAINVDVPDENIIRRMGGRRACVNCGATYHLEHIPPRRRACVTHAAASSFSETMTSRRPLKSVSMFIMDRPSPLLITIRGRVF